MKQRDSAQQADSGKYQDSAAKLSALANKIWIAEAPFKLFGAEFGNRMTIIQTEDDKLLLHSPLAFSKQLKQDLERLGRTCYLIAPNCWHNLYIEQWQKAIPGVKTYAPKNISKVRTDVSLEQIAMNGTILEWNNEIQIHPIHGMPRVNEFAFFHSSSRTLILTDLAFNIGGDTSAWTKLLFQLYGAYDRFGPTRLTRALIKDKIAFRQSLSEIEKLPFARIIVSHGRIVEQDAKTLFRNAFSF